MREIEKSFEEVRKEFKAVEVRLRENPYIPAAAGYNPATKIIEYNPVLMEKYKKYAKDIFRHEFGHHKWLPGSLEGALWQEMVLSKHVSNLEELATVLNLFNDVAVNLRVDKSFKDSKLHDFYKVYWDSMFRSSKLGGTLLKLYEVLTGKNWGSLNYDKKVLDDLLKIPWKERGWTLGKDYKYEEARKDLVNFYKAIRDLLRKDRDLLPRQYKQLPKISEKEGRKIARRLLRKGAVCPREVAEWYKKRFPEKVKEIVKRIMKQTGILPGTEAGTRLFPSIDIVLQYLFEIERYDVRIEPFMIGKQTEEVTQAKPWDLGEPFRDVRYSSYRGMIIPGVTPVRNVRENTNWGLEHRSEYPNLLIILDDSGSRMWQYGAGFHQKVIPDVVVSGVVAKKYLLEGAKVGVIKFSWTTQYFGYFEDLETIIYVLASFEGGGTVLDTNIVREAIQEGRKGNILPDVLLVTDGFIANAEELVEVFNQYAGRAWVFFMNPTLKRNEEYYNIWKRLRKGGAYFIEKPEEILNTVLK